MTNKVKNIPQDKIPQNIQPLLDAIAKHLIQRGIYVGYLQTEEYQIMLDDCAFWLNYDERSKMISLGFSQNPLNWDVEAIRIALLEDEHRFLEEKGAAFVKDISSL